jgi:hypothetical protein
VVTFRGARAARRDFVRHHGSDGWSPICSSRVTDNRIGETLPRYSSPCASRAVLGLRARHRPPSRPVSQGWLVRIRFFATTCEDWALTCVESMPDRNEQRRFRRLVSALRGALPIASILLVCGGCRSREISHEPPTIVFKQRSGVVQDWRFDLTGLPAIDVTSRQVVVADPLEDGVMSTPALELQWLSPASPEPRRRLPILSTIEFFHVQSLADAKQSAATARLVSQVRPRVDEASRLLRNANFAPLARCTVPSNSAPRTLQCGAFAADFQVGRLSWKLDGRDHTTTPLPEEPGRSYSLQEAWIDSERTVLAVRMYSLCNDEPTDACARPPKWRVVGLR